MNLKKKLGKRIRKIRIEQSLTQEMLAEKLGLSAKTLSQIELGNNFVSAKTLDDICSILKITPKTLFDFELDDKKYDDILNEIIARLKNNPNLLKTVYKIVLALDY